MDVSVITVTFNSASYIGECAASVLAQKGVEVEHILVDNASSDHTLEVCGKLGPRVRVLANQQNVGFGLGCNAGAALATGRFLYLLNPDAQLTCPDFLQRLVQALDEHPCWGLAGTTIRLPNGRLMIPHPHLEYPNQIDTRMDFSRLPGSVAWVVGASMFFRRQVYVQAGGFDPDFFLYSEETDLCLRVRKLGYEIGYLSELEICHINGATERERDPFDVWTNRMTGLVTFWRKHYSASDVRRLLRRERLRALYHLSLCRLGLRGHGSLAERKNDLAHWRAALQICSRSRPLV